MSDQTRESVIRRNLNVAVGDLAEETDLWLAILGRIEGVSPPAHGTRRGPRGRIPLRLGRGAGPYWIAAASGFVVAVIAIIAIFVSTLLSPQAGRQQADTRGLPGSENGGRAAQISCTEPVGFPCAFGQDEGVERILEADLGNQISMPQTIGDWTVTIERVYADRNRVVVAYMIDSPARSFDEARPELMDTRGRTIPWHGSGGSGFPEGGRWRHAEVVWFDGAGVVREGHELRLRFRVPSIKPLSDDAASREAVGPFAFDLRIPVEPAARVAEPGQQVQTREGTVTLERVVVTPTETRVYLRGVRLEGGQATLSVGGWDSTHAGLGERNCYPWPTGLTACSFGASLIDKRGEWLLSIPDAGLAFRFAVP